ncbi:MarR family winged helix-turn-helix transcriptional regulator [Streptomyces sp. NPDC050564]|uniref:MarR family winged helix-turn-helix transcriptional regulator n=1 Tax=Streptomyces sp. NPDC050564 TaxID=3365631 RepID=UPI0037B5297E
MSSASPAPAQQPPMVGEDRLSFAIFSLARAHRAYAAGLLRDLGLHPGQELLLMQLLDRDGQSQSELLNSVGLDHSTVSKSLRRMQEAGLLTREPAEHDRRVQLVRLTEQGRAMREPLRNMWATLEETSTKDLDAQEVETLVRLARKVENSMTERSRAQNSEG